MRPVEQHKTAIRVHGSDDDLNAADPARQARLRRWTARAPTGRAMLGAALVVLAAAGVLVAHRAATRPPTTRFVIVTHDVAAGTTLEADDLGTLAMELPHSMAAVRADDARSLVGDVTLHPLRAFDLLRRSDLTDRVGATDAGSVEVPVEVDRGRSLGGAVHAGTRVDVLSTDPDGAGTVVLARNALVVAVEQGEGGIGSTGGSRYRLAVPDPQTATEVVDASVRARLTLVLPDPGASRG